MTTPYTDLCLDISEKTAESSQNAGSEDHTTTNGEVQEVGDGAEQPGESMSWLFIANVALSPHEE